MLTTDRTSEQLSVLATNSVLNGIHVLTVSSALTCLLMLTTTVAMNYRESAK